MCNRYGRADWWDDRAIKLHAVLVKQRNQAKADALYVAKKHSRSVVADDVVAALTFGFWGGLLASGGPLQFETAYWQPFLHRAFPHYVGSRADLHSDLHRGVGNRSSFVLRSGQRCDYCAEFGCLRSHSCNLTLVSVRYG